MAARDASETSASLRRCRGGVERRQMELKGFEDGD
jgi:hypothetical protein